MPCNWLLKIMRNSIYHAKPTVLIKKGNEIYRMDGHQIVLNHLSDVLMSLISSIINLFFHCHLILMCSNTLNVFIRTFRFYTYSLIFGKKKNQR